MESILLTICIMSGILITANLLASIVEAAQGDKPRMQLGMGIIFVLTLYVYIGWWSMLVAVVLILLGLIAAGLWKENSN